MQSIEQRIRDLALFKIVAGSVDLASLKKAPRLTPACYVINESSHASANRTDNIVRQRVEHQIGIVFVVRNLADARGQAASLDLQALRDAVQVALLGFEPALNYDGITYKSGKQQSFFDGAVWYQDTYATANYIKSI